MTHLPPRIEAHVANDEAMSSHAHDARRWWIFCQERFPFSAYLPMLSCFVLANATLAATASSQSFAALPPVSLTLGTITLTMVVTLSFFFRLRCFDEIKDYEVDLAVNPTRPLARGLLSITDLRRMLVVLTLSELGLTALLGPEVFTVHLVAVAYSYLMYREFFIGSWLRPRLTRYAVMHTAVAALMGWSIAAHLNRLSFADFPRDVWLFGFVNWALFNYFEFSRKTFAPLEERPHADSYSSLFKPSGAVLLCISQIVLAVAAASFLTAIDLRISIQLALALPLLAAALYYVHHKSPAAARLFRGLSNTYILLFYAVLAWQGLA